MRVSLALLLAAAGLFLPGCRKAEVSHYRVASERPEPLPPLLTGAAAPGFTTVPSDDMTGTAVPTATGDNLTWTAPAHWKPKPASAMRKGSYAVPGDIGTEADFSITAFPGDVGGELANVNRWRGQLELPPLSESELAQVVTRLDQNGLHFAVAEFVTHQGAKPQRIVGALVPFGGATWFFKLMGPEVLVAREKPAFFAFLKTVQAPVPATR